MTTVTATYGTIRSKLGPMPRTLVERIDELTSAYVPGYLWNPLYEMKKWNKEHTAKVRVWDGKRHLLWKPTKDRPAMIPTGLLHYLTEQLAEEDVALKVAGLPPKHHLDLDTKLVDMELRPYQLEACKTFLALPMRRGVIRAGTGSGKTVIEAVLSRSFGHYYNVLGLVHGNTLLAQVHKDIAALLAPTRIGLIGNKEFSIERITVASIDTLYSRLKREDKGVADYLRNEVGFVWADEVHHASSMLWAEVLKVVNADVRLGLSGTPFKKDEAADLSLMAWTGPQVVDVPSSDLQEEGYLAQARLTMIENFEPDGPDAADLNWWDASKYLIEKNGKRNNKIARLAVERAKAGKSVLVLAGNNLRLCYDLYKRIAEDYEGVEVATGQYDVHHNTKALDHLRAGIIKIVVATVIFDEGVNVPALDCVIFANAGKSFVKTLQRIGRGLRPKDDGAPLELIDFMDRNNKYLRRHTRKRLDYYEEEGIFSRVDFFPANQFDDALKAHH